VNVFRKICCKNKNGAILIPEIIYSLPGMDIVIQLELEGEPVAPVKSGVPLVLEKLDGMEAWASALSQLLAFLFCQMDYSCRNRSIKIAILACIGKSISISRYHFFVKTKY